MGKYNKIDDIGIFLDNEMKNIDIKNSTNSDHICKYKNILSDYVGSDWKKYIKLDEEKYQRIKCYQGKDNKFAIYIISWNSKQFSPIHCHPQNGCLLKVLQGNLHEERYNDNKLINKCLLNEKSISYIHDNIAMHKIINKNNYPVFSMHIYSPPI